MYLLRSSVHTAGDDDVLPGRWPQLSPLGCCCQAPEITDNTEKCKPVHRTEYLRNIVAKDNLHVGCKLNASRFDQAAMV